MQSNPINILLTGGTGFLGSSLLRRLAGSGHRVVLVKRSGSDLSRTGPLPDTLTSYDIDRVEPELIFRENRIDLILHCATNYGRGDDDPRGMLEANLFLPLTLLELGRRNGVSCFINTDTILDKRVSAYSLSKSQFRDWLKLYSSGMTCINAALEHFYGPGDDRSKFVTFIVRSMLDNTARISLTPGEQKRDFIYIDDVVDIFRRIIGASKGLGNGFFSYEIGTGESVRIRDFVGMVQRLVGNCGTIPDFGALPYREHEVMESFVDTSAVMALGWNPSVTLEEGLRRTIEAERMLA
jgi:nucleoside-diphosphate-sugar epimerase